MKKVDVADNINAKIIAGCTTELAVWRFVRDVSYQLSAIHSSGKVHGNVSLDNVRVSGKSFCLVEQEGAGSSPEDVWQLGACIYELVTGNLPFGGRGKKGQEEWSPLPSFCGSTSLSTLTQRCLCYRESDRISAKEIAVIAEKELSTCELYVSDSENLKYKKPQNRLTRMKTYHYWPEAMVMALLLFLLAIPQSVSAQYNAEMEKLIRLTTTMRNHSKRTSVLNELQADPKWTLMDQLEEDDDECTYSDKVDEFGMNHIAAEIAQREKGIVNAGGRFRNSTNRNYNYSFFELTAKAGKEIAYTVKGHKGTQQIAIVPFHKNLLYTALVSSDNNQIEAHTVKDGIAYFTVQVGTDGTYRFRIQNKDSRNASFVVITYNPWK